MQIPKYRNFDCLSGSLKDYIWVIFSPDHFLDLISRLCPEGARGRWDCRGKLWELSIPGGAAATEGLGESSRVELQCFHLVEGAGLHHCSTAGPAEVGWCCKVAPHLSMGLAKNSVIFFTSLSERV